MMSYLRCATAALLLTGLGCGRPLSHPVVQPQLYEIGPDSQVEDSPETVEMRSTIAPYTAQLESAMNRVLAEVGAPLTKGQPESSLGNWTADLLLAAARDLFPDREVAFAVQNYGGLRISEIAAGPLVVSQVFELMPFDNELVLVEVTGAELREFVDHTLAEGGWPVSEGLSAVRSLDTVTVRVGGAPVDPAATYYIAAPDYVANGGNDSAMLVGKKQLPSGRMIRDLLIDYAGRSTAPIEVVPDGSRIQIDNR